jgi:hypothetical protein
LHKLVKGKGAISYALVEGKTYITDDNIGKRLYVLDFDIKELAVTPELEVGDLLLMSGDVIHQTQDTETYRISASVRMLYSKSIVNYQTFIRGGYTKRRLMFGNQSSYNYMINVFRKYKKDDLSIKTFIESRDKLIISLNFKPRYIYDTYMNFLIYLDRWKMRRKRAG